MNKNYPKWFYNYLFDESRYSESDTSTINTRDVLFCNHMTGGKDFICIGNEDHLSHSARVWTQIDKQYDLYYKYFRFVKNYRSSNRYTYHCLFINKRILSELPDFIDITEEKYTLWLGEEKSYYIIKVKTKHFVKRYNLMLAEYLYWCMDNHKCCENGLIFATKQYEGSLRNFFITDKEWNDPHFDD